MRTSTASAEKRIVELNARLGEVSGIKVDLHSDEARRLFGLDEKRESVSLTSEQAIALENKIYGCLIEYSKCLNDGFEHEIDLTGDEAKRLFEI